MNKRDRESALLDIAQEMKPDRQRGVEAADNMIPVPKPQGVGNRALSPVSWYPKSKKLKRELQMLAWNESTSMAALLHEGLVEVFRRRGKNIDDYL